MWPAASSANRMSLLFEYAVDQFSLADASLYAASDEDASATDDTVPVRPIGEFASNYDSLVHPEEDWICIPLHDQDSAQPCDEYVAFTDHQLRGRIFLVERGGEPKAIATDEFGATRVADRLRFWHSDYLPETYPPDYDSPIADHEDPRNPVETDQFIDGLAEYVAAERTATKDARRERARSQSARAIYEQGGSAIPSLVFRTT